MKNIMIIIVFFFVSACSYKSSMKFNDEIIIKMASEDFNLPSQYSFFYFFAKCKNDKLVQTNINELRVLYKRENSNMKFDEFLREVLNQQRRLDISNTQDCFVLDSNITDEYNKVSFESFKKTFFEKKNQKYILRKDVETEKRNTIFYYCFLNNYFVTFDDYIGYYYLNEI